MCGHTFTHFVFTVFRQLLCFTQPIHFVELLRYFSVFLSLCLQHKSCEGIYRLFARNLYNNFVQAQFSPRAQIALLLSSGGLDLIQSTTNEFTASCNYLLVYDLSDKWMYRQTVLMSSSLKSSRAFYVHTSDILSACEEIHFFNQPRLLKIIFLCC